MRTRIALASLFALSSCAATTDAKQASQAAQGSTVLDGQQAPPANLAELVAIYGSQSGTNITYDAETAELLESIPIRTIGPPDLRVLQIASVAEDAAAMAPGFEVIPLQYAAAPELAVILSDLTRSASRGTQGEDEVKVMSDPRTNALLVMAPSPRMAEIQTLVARLDVARTESED